MDVPPQRNIPFSVQDLWAAVSNNHSQTGDPSDLGLLLQAHDCPAPPMTHATQLLSNKPVRSS